MLLMGPGEIENFVEADSSLVFECRMLVQDIVDKFGKEYYNDKQYVMYMKDYNKQKRI